MVFAMNLEQDPDAATFYAQAAAMGCAQASYTEVAQGGGGGAPPECEVQLLTQKIQPAGYATPFNHTSTELLMQYGNQTTTTYLNGVPSNGYLTLVAGSTPYYSSPLSVVWSSGFSAAECLNYFDILDAAGNFPNSKYFYGLLTQNSNSLTSALLLTESSTLPWYINLEETLNPLTPGWGWPLTW